MYLHKYFCPPPAKENSASLNLSQLEEKLLHLSTFTLNNNASRYLASPLIGSGSGKKRRCTLLNQLASLGHLHFSLRQQCSQIVSTHPSTIARAVASGIDAYHLQNFRNHVVQVEASVLKRASGVVGGYDIVALARILSDFGGWDRTLQYLDGLAAYMLDGLTVKEEDAAKSDGWLKGSELINRLRSDIHTGYPSLEEVSLRLLQIAETSWLRQVSIWVLYGRLPTFGAEDFFVKESEGDGERLGDSDVILKDYYIKRTLLPEFVTPQLASSILFIGRSLAHIRIRGGATHYMTPDKKNTLSKPSPGFAAVGITAPELGLLPVNLLHLQSLRSPLSPQKFSNAISAIRLSLSKHTLQTLLPASKIVHVLHVLREFFLLGRGEFAISLVAQVEQRMRERNKLAAIDQKAASFMKEGEVAAVLTRTWGILSSFQSDDVLDERLDTAKEQIYLSLVKLMPNSVTQSTKKPDKEVVIFNDLLIGVPVSLNFHITWPMELFLTPADVEKYDTIFSYLISSRKCLISLQSLWRGRRMPTSIPGLSNDRIQSKLLRDRLRKREQEERNIWATTSLATFFLETTESYWQEEIIGLSFARLISLVEGPKASKKRKHEEDYAGDEYLEDDSAMKDQSRPTTATLSFETQAQPLQQDPESLTKSHNLFLNFLYRGLFISDPEFTVSFLTFLTTCTTLASEITRVQRNQSLQDLLEHSPGDCENNQPSRDMADLENICEDVKGQLRKLGKRLQKMDEERSRGKGGAGLNGLLMVGDERVFLDKEGTGKIDRLLMRLNLDHWLDIEDNEGGGEDLAKGS